jgi:hypothetical protein
MNLAITAIFQNEAPYLKEWIEFHLLMGAEHFYLFDHLSTDSPKKVLAPYLAKGQVTLISWPLRYSNLYEWHQIQCLAYERALFWAKGKVEWLAILDVDEFLFSVQKPLLETLELFKFQAGIGVNWQTFGTSNVAKIPKDKLLIETLNYKVEENQVTNHYIKSIVRPECVKACENSHSMTYKPGFTQVSTDETPFTGCLSPTVRIDLLRINHYTLRDEHYLTTQKLPRLKRWWKSVTDEEIARYQELNQVKDTLIHQFVPELLNNV